MTKTFLASAVALGLLAGGTAAQAQLAGSVGGAVGGTLGGAGGSVGGTVGGSVNGVGSTVDSTRDRVAPTSQRAATTAQDRVADVTTRAQTAVEDAQDKANKPVHTDTGANLQGTIRAETPAGDAKAGASGSVSADAHVGHHTK